MEEIRSLFYEILSGALKKSDYLKERESMCTRNETLPDLSKLNIQYKDEYIQGNLQELGRVLHFTEGYIILSASPRAPLLELDTKVCMENGLIVGAIDDIIGSVTAPHYTILGYRAVPTGSILYYPSTASILASLNRKKGTDASNFNDEETSEESSDDEGAKKKRNPRYKKIYKIFDQPPPFE